MFFEAKTYWLAKDSENPEQYQDAFELDPQRGIGVIADGAASGIFSGPWVRILCRAVAAEPPRLEDGERFQAWLTEQRARWAAGIDSSKLTWYQRPKLAYGGASTLLWVQLEPTCQSPLSRESSDEIGLPEKAEDIAFEQGDAARYRLRCVAIGDCCLFLVRGGRLARAFPIEDEDGFGIDPALIGSIDLKRDHLLEFHILEETCCPGDLLVLASDAIAQWATRRKTAGDPVEWERYWDMPEDAWKEEIAAERERSCMRFDDSTLLLLRVADDTLESAGCGGDAEKPLVAPDEVAKGPDAALVPAVSVEGERVEDGLCAVPPVSTRTPDTPPEAREPRNAAPFQNATEGVPYRGTVEEAEVVSEPPPVEADEKRTEI